MECPAKCTLSAVGRLEAKKSRKRNIVRTGQEKRRAVELVIVFGSRTRAHGRAVDARVWVVSLRLLYSWNDINWIEMLLSATLPLDWTDFLVDTGCPECTDFNDEADYSKTCP